MIGKVVSGSVNKGVKIILSNEENIELYPVGALVAIKGISRFYLGLITDAGIDAESSVVNKLISSRINEDVKDLIASSLGNLIRTQWVEVALIAQEFNGTPVVADSMPAFNSELIHVDKHVISKFFSNPNYINKWPLGKPKTAKKEVNFLIPIDVSKLIELSFAIYGKSGTGKTFLGNILASYITLYNVLREPERKVKLLIFDMHSEYALELKDNLGRSVADGVGKIFKEYFKTYTPDEELAKIRGLEYLKINYTELTPDDLRLIANIFNVTPLFITQLDNYSKILRDEIKLGNLWVWGFLLDELSEDEVRKSPEGVKILNAVLSASGAKNCRDLQRKIEDVIHKKYGHSASLTYKTQRIKLKRLIKYPFTYEGTYFENLINELLDPDGPNIIISLGKYEKEMPLYMILANIIARRLRRKVTELIEEGKELPVKVLIFLEEAHNFLGKETYYLSPFGDIARELRKRGITLCVIDQKPSELDPNVITMIWTNFIFTLTDDKDMEKALLGSPHPQLLKKIIPTLRRQEVLVYGESIGFPVTVRVIDYKEIMKKLQIKITHLRDEEKKKEMLLKESGLL